MPQEPSALIGADVFDGQRLHSHHAVLVNTREVQIVPLIDLPDGIKRLTLNGGTLLPAFVDLQVNGGGGVMFNSAPDIETLSVIAQAHATLGTSAFLATLITDSPAQTQAAIDAVTQAISQKLPGVIGLHLEGPHLAVRRKGAHSGDLIRPMTAPDLRVLQKAANQMNNLMVTLAPEAATPAQIKELADAGVIVSLGHSDCSYDDAMRAFDAGARCTTHLFNAMSQLSSRAAGLVGATLSNGGAAGLIADGVHVSPETIRIALAAKTGPGEIFLVTDAMACAGSEIDQFVLNGREIQRRDGQLTLADGTLAGADLSMRQALQVIIHGVGDPPAKAMARATSIPASLLNDTAGAGGWPTSLAGLNYIDAHFKTITRADRLA